MGGAEGARGYLYQAIACVLNSMREDNWIKVQMEPVTSEDKVDIAYEYEDGSYKAIQVKSSINNFTKGEIFNYFKSLIRDMSNANEYSLILIGTCSDNTKTIINSINKIRRNNVDKTTKSVINDLDPELKAVKEKLSIDLLNNDIYSLESNIMREFNYFLSQHGYSVDYPILELIVGAINYQFNKFSTNSSFITKKDYEKQILEWINFCYPQIQKGKRKRVSLIVNYYYESTFQDIFEGQKVDVDYLFKSKYVLEKKKRLISLFNEINSIQLSNKTAVKNIEKYNLTIQDAYLLYNWCDCEYNEELKEEIKDKSKKYLDITIEDTFFYLGNLKKEKYYLTGPFINSKPRFKGEQNEIEKYEKLQNFRYGLDELTGIMEMLEYIGEYYIIPLALRNIGEYYDEKIRVKLELPKDINLLTPDEFKLPIIDVLDYFIGDTSILNCILKHHSDSNVEEYPDSYIPIPKISMPYLSNKDYYDEIKNDYNEYKRYLEALMNVRVFDDNKDYKILEYEFTELKPKENIAFPSFILVKYDKSFKIRFKITSKNSSDVQAGELNYII
ncbi:conserved protein of unknown function [Tepidanaerobacter acetatoxydans Re1]|uniref:Uncharacterized protein n=1 Tax=Tepidanaerobacter acetatoxydans (strain DSM 21804 / JCM 16047 / Re1) TaxID=1209989 RepID=F4LSQ2_TEPAE|nr:hypothetical protein [Tepidanaerobacter acetatoxydans]AEE92442.1 hypothetical protein TepRe1_2328 [Tepidanaerobacter acetatoxydans Re1]CDI41011.1 conserved protein of unknown function [Tepidanaerobacter acetatoxydans Re1]